MLTREQLINLASQASNSLSTIASLVAPGPESGTTFIFREPPQRGFRGQIHGENTLDYYRELKAFVANQQRNALFSIAITLAFDNEQLPNLPNQSSDPEQDLRNLQAWCVMASRTISQNNAPLIDIEQSIPPLNIENGAWVKNKLAAQLEGIETRTLADYRQDGTVSVDRRAGKDKDGRIWRRAGTETSHPWYLKSSLKSQNRS